MSESDTDIFGDSNSSRYADLPLHIQKVIAAVTKNDWRRLFQLGAPQTPEAAIELQQRLEQHLQQGQGTWTAESLVRDWMPSFLRDYEPAEGYPAEYPQAAMTLVIFYSYMVKVRVILPGPAHSDLGLLAVLLDLDLDPALPGYEEYVENVKRSFDIQKVGRLAVAKLNSASLPIPGFSMANPIIVSRNNSSSNNNVKSDNNNKGTHDDADADESADKNRPDLSPDGDSSKSASKSGKESVKRRVHYKKPGPGRHQPAPAPADEEYPDTGRNGNGAGPAKPGKPEGENDQTARH